jgi:hypothetical protein
MPFDLPAPGRARSSRAALLVDFPVALVGGCVVACAAVAVALGAYWVTRPIPDPFATDSVTSYSTGTPGVRSIRLPWSAFAGPGAAQANEPIFITALPADGSLAPAERPSVLYARFVAADARSAPGGLIRRRFRDGTPFEGEDLVVAAPDGHAFWARCPSIGGPPDPASRCLTEMRFADTDVQVRFSPALLPRWELLASGLQRRFAPPAAPVTR